MNDFTNTISCPANFICSTVAPGFFDKSRFIPDQLLPLSISVLVFAVAALVLCAAFTVVYHHVRLAKWRMAELEMDRNAVINVEASDA